MRVPWRKAFFAAVVVLCGLMLAAYLILDPTFVNKRVTVSKGYGFERPEEFEKFRAELDAKGIPYSVETDGEMTRIWWRPEDLPSEASDPIARTGLLAEGSTGLCFPGDSKSAFDALNSALDAAKIPHTARVDKGELCVSWEKTHDSQVQEVYPKLKTIRQLEPSK